MHEKNTGFVDDTLRFMKYNNIVNKNMENLLRNAKLFHFILNFSYDSCQTVATI